MALMSLVDHVRYELELTGEEPNVIEGYIKIAQAFSEMGCSGGMADVVIPTIAHLLQGKNIYPLTDDPDEWMFHDAATWGAEGGIWQNKRNSQAFSRDGGKTYCLLSENKDLKHPEIIRGSAPGSKKPKRMPQDD